MRYKKRQSGKGLLTAVLPFLLTAVLPLVRAVLSFIGRSAASGAISLGASSLLGKIFCGKCRNRQRRKGRRIYKRYVK